MSNILVDADACPVKEEIYRVAKRYKLKVILVANSWMKTPESSDIELILADDQFDAADNWIVEHVSKNDIVITGDVLLAARVLEKEARVLNHKGYIFTKDSIGNAVANRDLQAQLRNMGIMQGGPAPFSPKDRSLFLQKLDMIIQSINKQK